jgi:WD40 repeat protein
MKGGRSVAFRPTSQQIATAGSDGTIKVWQLA